MRLTDLHPQWVGSGGPDIRDAAGAPVPTRERIGIAFDCPCGCGEPCYLPFDNPPDGGPRPFPGRPLWHREGETFETITLTPSIQRLDGCRWHGFIANGEARRC